ncbi:major facilitator superfamily domain-containing protein 10 [Fopius arisanus]|uniref:Major facilitator superfamily domain-containing protein 10 n=1 Tax=Fopius arisanus TaxID=64838 RepID=A0A9R1T6E3_9HYME|nr:PREDICTED: major facilitator superfamily domain-containing protein 10 [Fopius arisanus]
MCSGTLRGPKQAGPLGENKKMVPVVFYSLILDLLAFTMILPLLPALLDHYKYHDDGGLYSWILRGIDRVQIRLNAPDRFTSVLFGGFIGSMYSFLQFLSMPIVGALSDIYGRRIMMLLCLTGVTASYLLWALSHNFMIFVIARLVGGISKGNISLSMAIITDATLPSKRGRSMALVGIAFSIGFVLGPIIGVLFSRISSGSRDDHWYVYPALFAFSLSLVNLLYVGLSLEETLEVDKRSKSLARGLSGTIMYINPVDLFQFNGVNGLATDDLRRLRTLGRSYFLYLFIYSGLEFTLTFLTHHAFGFTSMQQGYMFLVIGSTMATLQGGFVRRIPADKTKFFAEFGLWLIIPAFVFIGIAGNVGVLYVGIFIFSVSTAMAVTCLSTLVTRIGPEHQKGTITGIFRSLGALARASGPIIASIAFWSIGSTVTYLIGAVVLAVPPLILHTVNNENDKKKS